MQEDLNHILGGGSVVLLNRFAGTSGCQDKHNLKL